ncbi:MULTISPECIES: nucleotidyltransferase domain-containing protein [Streptomyces]|uniref:Nucleotidyltransferase n=2 Tax=Streptomyces TaxID=1883 RepID=A0A2U9P4D1_STRAS|nr:nucleotidyltransferase domain-containing protein [Streptomyces actuosus]AWT44600.1 nucleotidyltransferase [Streptomyces actuosus]MBM4820193.1 nucleotidyltransferase domain-containing protein [Streptomyces actuosus]
MPHTVRPQGLDPEGFLAREGSLARVPHAFRPVVAVARDRLTALFGARLDSAYLYGSIPRGTARVGRSDLDLLVALREEPADADRDAVRALGEAVDREFPQIDGVGTLLYSRARLLSEAERYDLGWFVACLCTPLLGEDLAARLPRYRPDSRLARDTNGDLGRILPRWRERIAAAGDTEEARRPLVRFMSRHLVRTGFTLVMPRWNGWTSDLGEMAEVFGAYYPRRADQLRAAAVRGHEPVGDPEILRSYVDDLGPWLPAEYARVHGRKALRADEAPPADDRRPPADGTPQAGRERP